jgi:hypothetical protein
MSKQSKWYKILAVTIVATIMLTTVCLACDPHTIGFWGNKNGEKVINAFSPAVWIQLSNFLNLKDADGNDFNPTNFAQFKTWLRGANAVNMKYMLSAQLAAAELTMITQYSPDMMTLMLSVDTRIDPDGAVSLPDLIWLANNALNTLDADADREMLGLYSNALDNFNNNLNIIP